MRAAPPPHSEKYRYFSERGPLGGPFALNPPFRRRFAPPEHPIRVVPIQSVPLRKGSAWAPVCLEPPSWRRFAPQEGNTHSGNQRIIR